MDTRMTIAAIRQHYHTQVFNQIIRIQTSRNGVQYPNFADIGNAGSVAIAGHIVGQLGYTIGHDAVTGQTSGGRFENITKDFLQDCFNLLNHLQPGTWQYSVHQSITNFAQYQHLAYLAALAASNNSLAAVLGTDYIIALDIVVSRAPFSDAQINQQQQVVDTNVAVAQLTPMREVNNDPPTWFLHASISSKWTLRSDRAQNARAEALNLIRNRKGRLPHIVAVTAEPLPTRINSLALGTGDLDCVYHFALPELQAAITAVGNQDQAEALETLINGRRLRDISDLPFDLLA